MCLGIEKTTTLSPQIEYGFPGSKRDPVSKPRQRSILDSYHSRLASLDATEQIHYPTG
jgi:hypothetical protein